MEKPLVLHLSQVCDVFCLRGRWREVSIFPSGKQGIIALADVVYCCWDLCLLGLLASLPSPQVLWEHSPQFVSLTDPEPRLRGGSLCTGVLLGMGSQRRTMSYQARAHLVPL